MDTEQPKIYHHNTPRQYLLAWADADERIAWLGYGKLSRSRLTVVGGENDSYRLKELTVPDVDCLKLSIDGLREHGRDGHKRFLQMYLLPTRLKALLEQRIAEQQQRVAERGASEDENRGNFTRELKAASDHNLELTGTYHYGRRFPGDKSFSAYCEVIGRSRHQTVESVGPVITRHRGPYFFGGRALKEDLSTWNDTYGNIRHSTADDSCFGSGGCALLSNCRNDKESREQDGTPRSCSRLGSFTRCAKCRSPLAFSEF